ncbi:hypothetical protein [Streptomyces sp. NPDC058614]|uniref:hypothetical protein n=1 Tax=Streptomyces sp. NPDC058614 TaxID=3346557 RepID=UPI00364FCD28
MRLLMACWRSAAARCTPVMCVKLVLGLWQDGFTWGAVGEDVGSSVLVWGAVSLVWAAVGYLTLARLARGAGVELSVRALDERQIHSLRTVGVRDGWQERVRGELTASDRAFLVAERGREEIRFRWRPGRVDRSVWGSLAFDAGSGTVQLDIRDGEGNSGVAGLRKGASFVAVCQIARVVAPAGVAGDGARKRGGGPAMAPAGDRGADHEWSPTG